MAVTPAASAEWAAWAVALGLGFPVAVVALSEAIHRLERAGRALAGPLRTVRNVLLPIVVGLLLVTQVFEAPPGGLAVRVANTAALIAVIWVALSFVNAVVFGEAPAGTWRARVPKLLRDLVLLGLILFGAAVVLSAVWDISLAGLVTALGLGSIVIGLALQDTLGSIMSGIALLSERPFTEGDWLEVGDVEGRVVEMNWRAVRLLTRSGDLVVVPHLVIAKEVVRNYSQPAPTHADTVTLGFGYEHPPNVVKGVLAEAARETPGIVAAPPPVVRTVGYGDSAVEYDVMYWMDGMAERFDIRERFMTRVWYAAQRAHLNIPFPIRTVYRAEVPSDADRAEAFGRSVATVPLFGAALGGAAGGDGEPSALPADAALRHFGAGERVLREGDDSDELFVILAGTADLTCRGADGLDRPVTTLERGGLFGIGTLFSARPAEASVTAATDLQVVVLQTDAVHRMLDGKRMLVRELGQLIEGRRRAIEAARAAPPVEA